jgi:hypothetical protein
MDQEQYFDPNTSFLDGMERRVLEEMHRLRTVAVRWKTEAEANAARCEELQVKLNNALTDLAESERAREDTKPSRKT